MSLRECILNANKEGIINDVKKAEIQQHFDSFEADFIAKGMSKTDAEKEAGKLTFDALKHNAAEKKRQSLLTLQAQAKILKWIKEFRNVAGELDPAEAMIAVLASNHRMPFTDVEARFNTVRGQIYQRMTNYLLKFRRNMTGGIRNADEMKDVVREMFQPGSTKNPIAADLAAAAMDAMEFARLKFNAAGGRIAKLKNYGMPQHHDSISITKYGKQAWIDKVKPMLDRELMINEKTGLKFDDGSLEIALGEVWETITTEGFNKQRPGSAAGFGKSIANRRMDHRFLKFKDADTWMEYQEMFGKSDPFSTVVGHLDSMARDIASMEILGANPNATIRWMTQFLRKQGALDDQKGLKRKNQYPSRTNKDRMNTKINLLENIWNHHNGSLNAPVEGSVARTLAGTRQILTSAQLGSAALLSLGDFNFTRIAAKFNGIPASKAMFSNLKQMVKGLGSDELADLAMSSGIIGETFLTVGAAQARFMGEVFAPEIAKRINETVLRASGLSHITQSGKFGFGMEFFRHIAREKNKTFKQLKPKFRQFFERNGFGETHWNLIRNTPVYEYKGITFIRPDDIYSNTNIEENLAKDISSRLMDAINREIEFAVPSSSYRAKASIKGNAKPGTLGGELLLSAGMYKNFTLTLAFTHIARGLFGVKGLRGKTAYMGGLIISTTLIGALTYELKNLTKGKDITPEENRDIKYWMNAMIHGGGLGIFGDFFFAGTNRFGGGYAQTAVGAVGSFVADVLKLGVVNPINLIRGEKVNYGNDISNFIKRYTPGASLWYIRLVLERYVFDTLQEMIDPDFDKRVRRKEKRSRKTTGLEYWWGSGEKKPDRLPNINPTK